MMESPGHSPEYPPTALTLDLTFVFGEFCKGHLGYLSNVHDATANQE